MTTLPVVERSGESQDLAVLDQLRGQKNVSQRSLADAVGLAPSQVNRCIRRLLTAGLVEVEDRSVRPFAYRLTPLGESYRLNLLHQRFERLAGSVREMREHIRASLRIVAGRGLRRLVLCGAGEAMEMAITLAGSLGLEVVGLVDPDPQKQGARNGEMPVQPPAAVASMTPDAVLLTTFVPTAELRALMASGLAPSPPVLEL